MLIDIVNQPRDKGAVLFGVKGLHFGELIDMIKHRVRYADRVLLLVELIQEIRDLRQRVGERIRILSKWI